MNLGKLSKIIIGHDGEGGGSGWYLDEVNFSLHHICLDQSSYFVCHCVSVTPRNYFMANIREVYALSIQSLWMYKN